MLTFLVFLGLLPLVNGFFDYLSYGVTLTLLRAGVRAGTARALALGIADAGIALILFTALGTVLILILGLIQWFGGVAMLPLDDLFYDLRDPVARWNYVWLFAMMFSTALPTLIHFVLASLSCQGLFPLSWRRKLFDYMNRAEHDHTASFIFHAGIGLMWALSLAVPVVLVGGLGFLIWHMADDLGGLYLSWYEWVAVATGQLPDWWPRQFDPPP